MNPRDDFRPRASAATGARPVVLLALWLPVVAAGCHGSAPAAKSTTAEAPSPTAFSAEIAARPAGTPTPPRPEEGGGKKADGGSVAADDPGESVTIPDLTFRDQDGRTVRFASELIRGKVFLISFGFKGCSVICPLLTAKLNRIQRLLDRPTADDVRLITVSVDPEKDEPDELKIWAANSGAGSGWTFVTGRGDDLRRLLIALHLPTSEKTQHSQSFLIGDGRAFRFGDRSATGTIWRLGERADPQEAAERLRSLASQAARPAPEVDRPSPAEVYFTTWADPGTEGGKVRRDIVLVDQDGKQPRFYADLLKDRNVIVHAFFSKCTGACPKMFGTMSRLQDQLGDRLGKDVFMISLTVDPTIDEPGKLREFAEQLHARPGWSFLTGRPDDVEAIVRKIHPQFVAKESHSTCFFIGNLRNHTWAKPDVATHTPEQIIEAARRIWDEASPGVH